MHVAIGSDHAGFELKEAVKTFLAAEHHQVVDVGTHNQDPVDYPDYAQAVGAAVRESRAERGILLGVQLEPSARKSCPASPGWPRNDDERDGPGQRPRPDDRHLLRGGARRGAAASVDAVTDVVLVLNAGSSRCTLACIRRGGPR